MKTILVGAMIIFSTAVFANVGESQTERWQCYAAHASNAALVDRDCVNKAYEATQFTGRPARCVMGQGVSNYCEIPDSIVALMNVYFAVVWPK